MSFLAWVPFSLFDIQRKNQNIHQIKMEHYLLFCTDVHATFIKYIWVSAGTKFTLAKNAKQGKISLAFSELL